MKTGVDFEKIPLAGNSKIRRETEGTKEEGGRQKREGSGSVLVACLRRQTRQGAGSRRASDHANWMGTSHWEGKGLASHREPPKEDSKDSHREGEGSRREGRRRV